MYRGALPRGACGSDGRTALIFHLPRATAPSGQRPPFRCFAAASRSSDISATSCADGEPGRISVFFENSCSFRIRLCLYFGSMHIPARHREASGHALHTKPSRNFLYFFVSPDVWSVLRSALFFSSPRLPSVPGRRCLLSLLFREGLHALRTVALPPVGP